MRLRQGLPGRIQLNVEAEALTKQDLNIRVSVSAKKIDTAKGKRILACLQPLQAPTVGEQRDAGLNEIVRRKRTKESPRESDQRFQIMADTAPVLIWQSGTDKLCNYFNKRWLDFTGRAMEQELGNGWSEGVHADDLKRCFDIYSNAFEARQEFSMEYRLRRHDGQYRWVLDNGVPIFSTEGAFEGYVGSCIDITDRRQAERSQRESQTQLASIIGSAMDAIITVDTAHRVVLFNTAAEKMFQCAATEAIGQQLDSFIPQRFRAAHQTHIRTFGETNISSRSMGSLGAIWGLRADGREFPIEASISRTELEGEKLFTVIIRDISRRNLMDHEVRLQARLLDLSHEAVFVWDLHGSIRYWNQGAEELYGWKSEEVLGKVTHNLLGTVHPIAYERIEQALLEDGHWAGELTHHKRDGREIVVESRQVLVREDADRLQVLETNRDITERKRAEEQVRRQAALLDQSTDAILLRDLEERILFWSKGAERIYGWTLEEVLGKHIRDIHHREINREFYEAKQTLLETGDWSGEAQQITKSGERLLVNSRWKLLRDREGNPESVLVIHTDITEKKKLEAQFLRAQRMESIGALAGGIAHDINNALSPILMAIRMLEMKFPDEDARRILKVLQTSAQQGADMVRQILEFARGVEGERMILQPGHLITEMLKVLKDTLTSTIEISSVVPASLWPISADPTQVRQVLLNLFVNARDAMPHGGRVVVEAENILIDENYARMDVDAKPGHYVRITVGDNGTGIPARIMDKVFDPFFTTKEYGKGSGLGLSTVMTIVKSHGGFINVYSEERKGTEFKVYLPAAETMTFAERADSSPEVSIGHGELILVADDESAVREITKSTLETYGYQVLTAGDGSEAVGLFAQYRDEVRVVLADLMMPYMDGVATIRAIKKLNPRIRVILSSGLKESGRVDAASAGANAFLSKPYTADRLLKVLADLVSQET